MGNCNSEPKPTVNKSSINLNDNKTNSKTKNEPIKGEPKPVLLNNKSDLSEFENNILNFHNQARQENGLPPLKWDKKLTQYAKDWGEFLKENENCSIRHPINSQQEKNKYIPNNIGQNLYVAHGYPEDPSSALDAVKKWYDECNIYNPPKKGQSIPDRFMEVGHFTQLMWKDAQKVGCARTDCPKKLRDNNGNFVEGKGSIITCNYDKGNIGTQFNIQVPWPVKCNPNNDWVGGES